MEDSGINPCVYSWKISNINSEHFKQIYEFKCGDLSKLLGLKCKDIGMAGRCAVYDWIWW